MKSRFFNALPTTDLATHPSGYDRTYDANDHADFWAPFFTGAGVFAGTNADACKVYVKSGLTLGIHAGSAFVKGRGVEFDGTETVAVTSGCKIVARMNNNLEVRAFQLLAVTELVRTTDIYDLELANVTVSAGVATVTDTRTFAAFTGQPPYYPPDSDSLPYILWLYTIGFPMTTEQRAAVEENPSLMGIYEDSMVAKVLAASEANAAKIGDIKTHGYEISDQNWTKCDGIPRKTADYPEAKAQIGANYMKGADTAVIDGTNISASFGTPNANHKGMAWSPTLKVFVAAVVSNDSSKTNLIYSPDGKEWFLGMSIASGNFCYSICWSDALSKFVASGDNSVLVSTDGKTWSQTSGISIGYESQICWCASKGIYVCIGNIDQSNYCYKVNTSTDGITWTQRQTTSTQFHCRQIIWADALNKFVAAGFEQVNSSFYVRAYISSDGYNFGAAYSGNVQNSTIYDVCWAAELNKLVFLGYENSVKVAWTSSDGYALTRHWIEGIGESIWAGGIAWSDKLSKLIACYNSSGGKNCYTSNDGITWTLFPTNAQPCIGGNVLWNNDFGFFMFMSNGKSCYTYLSTNYVFLIPDYNFTMPYTYIKLAND